ncbi:MAG: UDP-N-acetylmuramoyl-L-alanine--D-glutamate ligase [Zoogloeaceae bacterium]|jgi:UDP-N-acetylmuramoylalanine--D-glutamate ligase|nr:UDP-N-acetylmuramoyl-L-alanine--D-glutamate ligase [Zoogloeaceae bacterium]
MELSGKRFLVAGLGESGLAMAKWLHRQGAHVRVADSRETPPGRAALRAFAPEIKVITGAFAPKTFSAVDAIALSPGLPLSTPGIAASGIPVVSEVDLFMAALDDCQPGALALAITGSNGKTTTTALTAHLLEGSGISVVACGNISPSLLDALMAALEAGALPKVWVLELSSFQLEASRYLPFSAAAVLNVAEDHLDRHGDMTAYATAKARIFRGGASQVLNREDDWSLGMGDWKNLERMRTFGLDAPPRPGHYGVLDNALCCGESALISLDELPLTGAHHVANVMAALALCAAIGIDGKRLLPALRDFRGLPHRTTLVMEIAGVRYVDDSKGTNVSATLAAIRGMERKVALILGGEGKGQDFAPLLPVLRQHGRAVALIGRDGALIGKAIASCGLPMKSCADMPEAVRWLARQSRAGDCVLLSPACASFDMYKDYADRAAAFICAVEEMAREKATQPAGASKSAKASQPARSTKPIRATKRVQRRGA